MFRRSVVFLVMAAGIALLLSAASDAIFGPAVSTRQSGEIVGAPILSMYSLHLLSDIPHNIVVALRNPVGVIEEYRREPVTVTLLLRMLIIVLISGVISWVYVFKFKTRPSNERFVSGMRLLVGDEARADAQRQFKNESDANQGSAFPTINLAPGMPITKNQETRGFFLEGGTGSGKTVIIESLLAQAVSRQDKIVLYDIKGDFAPKLRDRLVLNPFAAESSVWAVARDVKTADQARQLARMLLPSDKSGDTFWDNAAHTIFSGILISLQTEKPGFWTFRDVWHLLVSPRETVIDKLKLHYPTAAVFFAEKAGASNMEQGVLATLSARLSPYIEPLAIAWGNADDQAGGFSFETWLMSEDAKSRTLILQGSPEHADAAAAWIRMAINYLAGVLVSPRIENDGPLRLWLIIDELPSLGLIPRLTDIVDRGRQKGVRTLVACQSLSQLELHYGEWARSAESTFGTRIFGRMSPGERTQSIIRSLGEQIFEVRTLTKTRNADGHTSETERRNLERRPVLSPEVFGTLGKQGNNGIDALIVGLTQNVLRARWPFPPKRPSFHPPFKLAEMDRSVLRPPAPVQKPEDAGVSKSFDLKLKDALDEFDSNKPTE